MKKIRYNSACFHEEQIIKELASALAILPDTARILYARGIDTVEKGKRFLSPGRKHLRSPFLMSGMREAVDRIREARDNGETVVVYGDYDADGISAVSIMYYALKKYGVTPYCFIPERSDGYGLSENTIEQIVGDVFPDLFITVDCGISGAAEVEMLKDAGVDVIVTDHHELPPVLPDCTMINPKIQDDYPFDGLCGAGVAFKIACALLGEDAYDLFDFAAIATIADSMPLVDENRDIVFEGVRAMEKGNTHPAFQKLLESANKKGITAMSLAFTLAPRINAAGRMGDANGALRLFLSDDENEIFDGCVKLNAYNTARQQECDVLYKKVKQKIREVGAYDRAIVLSSDDWAAGFVGIVAARLAEEYYRPVILFVEKEGVLKGSARSIDEVNIFDAVSSVRDLTIEFGGHAQAAGISITKENLDAFRKGICAYLAAHYDDQTFIPTLQAEWLTDMPMSMRFAKELEKIEPCGVGNRKPLFATVVENVNARPMKEGSPHLTFQTDVGEMLYFGAEKYLPLLNDDNQKLLTFEYNYSVWGKKEYLKGLVKDFTFTGNMRAGITAKLQSAVKSAVYPPYDGKTVEKEELQRQIETMLSSPYGTLFLAADESVIAQYPALLTLPRDLFYPSDNRLLNRVVLAPTAFDGGEYQNVVYLQKPLGQTVSTKDGAVVCHDEAQDLDWLQDVNFDRGAFAEVFVFLKELAVAGTPVQGSGGVAMLSPLPEAQVITATEVFLELGFISLERGNVVINKGVKAELSESALYRTLKGLQEGR